MKKFNTISEIESEIERLSDIRESKINSFDFSKEFNYEQFEKIQEPELSEICKLDRRRRLFQIIQKCLIMEKE